MLHLKDAIRVEKYYPPNKKNGGRKNQYIFKCKTCGAEIIKVKALTRLLTATGLCVKCNNKNMHPLALAARRLKPFQSCWNRIKYSANKRNLEFALSYKDFLGLTA